MAKYVTKTVNDYRYEALVLNMSTKKVEKRTFQTERNLDIMQSGTVKTLEAMNTDSTVKVFKVVSKSEVNGLYRMEDKLFRTLGDVVDKRKQGKYICRSYDVYSTVVVGVVNDSEYMEVIVKYTDKRTDSEIFKLANERNKGFIAVAIASTEKTGEVLVQMSDSKFTEHAEKVEKEKAVE